jgi:CheY-like chemotaxis protein
LVEVPAKFNELYGDSAEMRADIEERIQSFRRICKHRPQTEEESRLSDEVLSERGRAKFDDLLPEVRKLTEGMNPLEAFLFWMGHDWWFYYPPVRKNLHFPSRDQQPAAPFVAKYLEPAFPDQVRRELGGRPAIEVAVGFGHFAVMYGATKSPGMRWIVTDTQLYSISGVGGYVYLNVTADGKPVMRCCCDRLGRRAFFDGERLMSHDLFMTCAPKTVVFSGGYKFNSTRCSVVNGQLLELIEDDDHVAHTDGAFMGLVEFSVKDVLKSLELGERSAKRLSVVGSDIHLDGKRIKPVGRFQPSSTSQLDSGFTHYDWSQFDPNHEPRFDRVMVVDDRADWIAKVRTALSPELAELVEVETKVKVDALRRIFEGKPEALILDMHLTEDEEFDGLWIANTLIRDGFHGEILIASSYSDPKLRAMRELIKGQVHIPGKNIERVRACLAGKCHCF